MSNLDRIKADLETAREKYAGLIGQREDLVSQRVAAAESLEFEQQRLTDIMGLNHLGEATEEAVKHARQSRDEASDRVDSLGSAIRVLEPRTAEAGQRIRDLENALVGCASELAAQLVDIELRGVQRAADDLGTRLHRYVRLENLARKNTGFATGQHQRDLHGVNEILDKYRISGDVVARLRDGEDEMTADEVIAMTTPG